MQKVSSQPILFYSLINVYSFLSNFYRSPFKLGPYTYKTNQHYFQSKKFEGTQYQKQIIQAKSPKQAKKLGRKFTITRPQNWNQIKQSVMIHGLRAKFMQNQQLKMNYLQREIDNLGNIHPEIHIGEMEGNSLKGKIDQVCYSCKLGSSCKQKLILNHQKIYNDPIFANILIIFCQNL